MTSDKYVEEIRKIREKNYERTKNMTDEERIEDVNSKGKEVIAYMKTLKKTSVMRERA